MGYVLNEDQMNQALQELKKSYIVYAPKCFENGGRFSDTDCIRYGEIHSIADVEFEKKSEFSFKEILTPVSQTLFYFTEDSVQEAQAEKKGAVIFLRSCDRHAVRRLDDMYLSNGPADYYYQRVREKVHFIVMGCTNAYENCFCADMETNQTSAYDAGVNKKNGVFEMDCKETWIDDIVKKYTDTEKDVSVEFVTQTQTHVQIPEKIDYRVSKSSIWKDYDSRCIHCGRCNFVCPTCTCFTMQDIFYTDNGKVGERRRVWASCMVDGYTDVAGGGSYRKKMGERMRFKVLHKILDYKERNGYYMCVGCGRCDDVCPEYISFSHCMNRLEEGMKEVEHND